GPRLWPRRGERDPLQLPRLAQGRDRRRGRAALRRYRQSARTRALHDTSLSGERGRRRVVDLYGTGTHAGAADLGAIHLGERLSRGGAVRNPLQLVSVPGKLLRSRAFRVDARELG